MRHLNITRTCFGKWTVREGSKRGNREDGWETLALVQRRNEGDVEEGGDGLGGRSQIFQVDPSLSQPVKPTAMAVMC